MSIRFHDQCLLLKIIKIALERERRKGWWDLFILLWGVIMVEGTLGLTCRMFLSHKAAFFKCGLFVWFESNGLNSHSQPIAYPKLDSEPNIYPVADVNPTWIHRRLNGAHLYYGKMSLLTFWKILAYNKHQLRVRRTILFNTTDYFLDLTDSYDLLLHKSLLSVSKFGGEWKGNRKWWLSSLRLSSLAGFRWECQRH